MGTECFTKNSPTSQRLSSSSQIGYGNKTPTSTSLSQLTVTWWALYNCIRYTRPHVWLSFGCSMTSTYRLVIGVKALLAIISVTSAFSQYSIGVDLVSITQRQSNTIMGMPAQIVTPGAGLFVQYQTAESLLYRVAFSRQSFSRPAYGGNFVDFGNHNYYKIAAGVGKQWSAESTISPHLGADLYYATTSADGTQGGGFVPSSFSYEGSSSIVYSL